MRNDLEKPALALLHPDWKAPKRVHAVFTLREGGVSSGPFGGAQGVCGLNVGLYCGDAKVCVRTNRAFIAQVVGGEPRWLHQVHGTEIVRADDAAPETEADGAWTQTPGVVCAVQTADCLPVILADEAGVVVAALHAGWKGLAGGILQKGAALVRGKAGPGARVFAWLAPRIGPESFEVGGEVLEAMLERLPAAREAFAPGQAPGKWMADLGALARQALQASGIAAEDIADCGLSTVTDPDHFYSYRRDRAVTGRHAALVWISDKEDDE